MTDAREEAMTPAEARKIAAGTVQELRAQARTSREAYWLNGAADVIEALSTLPTGEEALREALRPFARVADTIDASAFVGWDNSRILGALLQSGVTLQTFFRARDALTTKPARSDD